VQTYVPEYPQILLYALHERQCLFVLNILAPAVSHFYQSIMLQAMNEKKKNHSGNPYNRYELPPLNICQAGRRSVFLMGAELLTCVSMSAVVAERLARILSV
jgi:hypothetical protein